MPWLRLDDKFTMHPKVVVLSAGAFRLHIAGLCYCARFLTDGRIPPDAHRLLVPAYRPSHLAELTKELWREEQDRSHWIHDYLDYNPSARDTELYEATRHDTRSVLGTKGNHVRWHLKRGITDPGCPFCTDPYSDRSSESPSDR